LPRAAKQADDYNPLTSFEINLPEGKYSALAANGNLCKPTVSKTVRRRWIPSQLSALMSVDRRTAGRS